MVFVIRAGKTNKSASDMYTAGGAFTGRQNGIAISGDYLSAASFLGIAGAIALSGYDGFLYSVGFLVAWLVALLLVAELLRNTGRFTMADVLAFRMRERPVRTAAATSTLVVSFFYLLAQMAGAGGLVALLMNITGRTQQSLVIAVVGALMIAYVLIGGMKGTTYVQIIKAVLLIAGAAVMSVWVLANVGMNFSELLGRGRGRGRRPGAGRQVRPVGPDEARLHLSRPGAGPGDRRPAAHSDAVLHRADREGGPQVRGLGDRPDRCLLPVHPDPRLRSGGTRRAGPDQGGAGRCQLGGSVAGLRTGRHGPARGHLGGGLRDDPGSGRRIDHHRVRVVRARHLRQCDPARAMPRAGAEVRVARISAVVVGIVAIIGGIAANGQNIAFLVALAFAVAASANLPTILYSLFWKRFNTRGCLWSIYGGTGHHHHPDRLLTGGVR